MAAPISSSASGSKPSGAGALRSGFARSNVMVPVKSPAIFAPAPTRHSLIWDQRDNRLAAVMRRDGNMSASCANGTAVARPFRRPSTSTEIRSRGRTVAYGHGVRRSVEAAARQQPAGSERFHKRHRQREASGNADDGKAVGEARARAAESSATQASGRPGVVERAPEASSFPCGVGRPVDGLRSAESARSP